MDIKFDSNMVSDYDEIYSLNINTKLFTDLKDVEIISLDHPFIHFFRGFVHNSLQNNIIKHGWYHVPTKTAKFYLEYIDQHIGNAIHLAWNTFWEKDNLDVSIYKSYCGQLYKSNEYDIEKIKFYKELINRFIDSF